MNQDIVWVPQHEPEPVEKSVDSKEEKMESPLPTSRRIERDSLKHYRILAMNGRNVESSSFAEIMGEYLHFLASGSRLRLKLKKHFNAKYSQIVNAYREHLREVKAMEEIKKGHGKGFDDSDSGTEDNEDSDKSDHTMDFEEIHSVSSRPSNSRRRRRGTAPSSRRRKKKLQNKSKRLKAPRLAPSASGHEFEESDYGTTARETADEHKSVEQMIEEHEGMGYIHEAMKMERAGNWEDAAVRYEKGIEMLYEYQREVQLPTRQKRELRNEVKRLRLKFQNLQNRLARGGRGSRMIKDRPSSGKASPAVPVKEGNNDENEEDGQSKRNKNGKSDPDKEFRDRLMGDIITEAPDISFQDVTGLMNVKLALYENVILPQLKPELFTGLRKPSAGLLLFGPPGNGKTMIAKCVATECDATFFSISASSITSKYVGEAERLMRTLFNLAREKQPSIIFIDEIDSLLTARGGNNEAESSRRIKTEFLVQFDGVKASADGKEARVLVIGATNLPEQLDEAVLRRFGKRILVPVPDDEARYGILRNLVSKQSDVLTEQDFRKIVSRTNLYSASDLTNLCKDAAMGPLRDLGAAVLALDSQVEVPPVQLKHFESALKNVRASVKEQSLHAYRKWDSKFGSKLTFELSSLPENMHAHPVEPLV